MLSHSRALIAAALVIGFSAPVMAQQPMRHYLTYFKYSDAAEKAMTENPTDDRAAAARKLVEGFGVSWMRSTGLYQASMTDSLWLSFRMTSPQWRR
jgi:hypothetical protein